MKRPFKKTTLKSIKEQSSPRQLNFLSKIHDVDSKIQPSLKTDTV